jgi:hypothetical protein
LQQIKELGDGPTNRLALMNIDGQKVDNDLPFEVMEVM